MDYYLLTDMAAQIGYELAAAGAETFRIEETMRRVLAAYGIVCETFAIPNCVMVSLEADNGKPLMVMKRVSCTALTPTDMPLGQPGQPRRLQVSRMTSGAWMSSL